MIDLLNTNFYPGPRKVLPACLVILLLLIGCGGSSSSGPTAEAPKGLWTGKLKETGGPDDDLFGIVSPNGWAVFILGLPPFPGDVLYTTGSLSADKTSGDFEDDLILISNGRPTLNYKIQGNYQPRTSLTASLTRIPATPEMMDLSWDSRTDITASLNKAAGTWADTRSGTARVITITSSGQLNGSDSSGCVYDGQVFEPTSNVNVYWIKMDVSGCFSPPVQFAGNATLLDTIASADTLLMATSGFSLFGYTKIGVLDRQ